MENTVQLSVQGPDFVDGGVSVFDGLWDILFLVAGE